MDKKENKKVTARREDQIFNRIVLWIIGAVVVELYLLFFNRYYVRAIIAEWDFRMALGTALPILSIVFGVCFVVFLVLWILGHSRGKTKPLFPFLSIMTAALAVASMVTYFIGASGVRFLYIGVPIVGVLALLYYLYQKEFFCIAVMCVLGLCGIYLFQHRGTHLVLPYVYLIVFAVVLIVAAVLTRMISSGGGKLKFGGKRVLIFPKNADYTTLYVTCIVAIAVVVGSIFLSSGAILYGIAVAWLLVMAVYYTVRLM
ncbi:MAG: hypothetical protein LIO58_00140 [Oscillospiraceae bacterium]|nr:hypothetical protein [Oscillospiraceae bacterium]